jgi:hypothetical protein
MKLFNIWFKLFITSLDIIYYQARLLFQRICFYFEEILDTYKSSQDNLHEKYERYPDEPYYYEAEFEEFNQRYKDIKNKPYAKNKSAHNKQESESSRSDYKPYDGPICETP